MGRWLFLLLFLLIGCSAPEEEDIDTDEGISDGALDTDGLPDFDNADAPAFCNENDKIDCFGTKLYQCVKGVWTLLTDCAVNNMKCVKPPSGPASCVVKMCGDGGVDTDIGEVCEVGDTATCADASDGYYDKGFATCLADCTGWDYDYCERICGNHQKDEGEACDGDSLSCAEFNPVLYGGGTAACKEDCSGYDMSTCQSKCPTDNPFCRERGGKYWSDILVIESSADPIVACQSYGGRLPTISELRSLVQHCPALEPNGGCGVTDSCLAYAACYEGKGCEGCTDSSQPAGYFSAFGDQIALPSISEMPSTFPMIWAIAFSLSNNQVSLYFEYPMSLFQIRCVK